MVSKSILIKTNKELLILNALKNYAQDNSYDYVSHISKRIRYYADGIEGIELDISAKDTISYFKNYINDLNNYNVFKNFVKNLKFFEGKRVSEKELLNIHGLDSSFNDWNEVFTFISKKIIPNY